MITPEYSRAYNCPACGWRRATTEDLLSVPEHDGPPPGDASR